MNTTTIRLIQVGCKSLGIDKDTRHAMQSELTGKDSLTVMTEAELATVLDHLKAKGFRPTTGGKGRAPARNGQLRYVHVLWGLLGTAGKLRKTGRAGLNAFVREQFTAAWGGAVPLDVDMLTDPAQVRAVTEALKAWCMRVGIEVRK